MNPAIGYSSSLLCRWLIRRRAKLWAVVSRARYGSSRRSWWLATPVTRLPPPRSSTTTDGCTPVTIMPSSHRHNRHNKTVQSVSSLWRDDVNWTIALIVQTSNFLSATVLSCRESNSHRRSGRDTDKTVLSCLAWRCGLAFSNSSSLIQPGSGA